MNIIYTHGWMMDNIREALKDHEITIQQYNVLRILKGASRPLSTREIKDRLVDRSADTSRLVERLCKKGFLEKEVCCKDKRLVDISLSDKGEQMLLKMEPCQDKIECICQTLTSEEAKLLGDLLDKLRSAQI